MPDCSPRVRSDGSAQCWAFSRAFVAELLEVMDDMDDIHFFKKVSSSVEGGGWFFFQIYFKQIIT